mmetsp:Transcript_71420/g.118693  ORF Transcript_71420/g.118693 Transcript_71420/m.118693 type:complete len:315 (-) Transcript_71420:732-1676(-)
MPRNWKSPSLWQSLVRVRSPSKTWMFTAFWLSALVEKTCVLRVGMTVLRGMSFANTPPTVSMPRVSGVTSSKTTESSFLSEDPERIAACTAAPCATASSGWTPLLGSLPLKKSLSSCWTFGMRVDPPTRTTSSTSSLFSPASASTFFTGARVFLNRSAFNSSNRARVSVSTRSCPSWKRSISTRTWCCAERARLARSTSRRSVCRARWSRDASAPVFRAKSFSRCVITRLSKSSPPRCVSPLAACTSKTPLSIASRETSKVPPPRSNTRTFFSPPFLSSPYAIAAAVGSFRMRSTLSPAIVPASFVACRCASLK